MSDADEPAFASRAGRKLDAALTAFKIDVSGWTVIDFGSHAGGFVDCLLRRGAARVHAVDPGYGILDYRLRRDPRVVVHERTNALRFFCPEPAHLVTIDVGWTKQRLILPAAARCLKPGGLVVTLVKPHYEAPREWLSEGVLDPARMDDVLAACRADVLDAGWRLDGETESPLTGHGGNVERLWLLSRAAAPF